MANEPDEILRFAEQLPLSCELIGERALARSLGTTVTTLHRRVADGLFTRPTTIEGERFWWAPEAADLAILHGTRAPRAEIRALVLRLESERPRRAERAIQRLIGPEPLPDPLVLALQAAARRREKADDPAEGADTQEP